MAEFLWWRVFIPDTPPPVADTVISTRLAAGGPRGRDGWHIGIGHLGLSSRLCPRDDPTAHVFTALVIPPTRGYTDDEKRQAQDLVDACRPAWCRVVILWPYWDVPPTSPLGYPDDDRAPTAQWRAWGEEPPRWRIGGSAMGLGTVVCDSRVVSRREWDPVLPPDPWALGAHVT
jgi:hypothetical protein